jgi:hypothetical protein
MKFMFIRDASDPDLWSAMHGNLSQSKPPEKETGHGFK